MRLIGISSGGGHLTELLMIMRHLPSCMTIITDEGAVSRNAGSDLPLVPICDPHRSPWKFVKNSVQALRYLFCLRPSVVISTGAGMTLPFFIMARLFGAKCIFVETGARVSTPSMTGRLLYRFSHLFIVQNSALLPFYQRATVASILPVQVEQK